MNAHTTRLTALTVFLAASLAASSAFAADRDNDGVGDAFDRCPDAAEVINGVDDDDGCPDADTDGDLVADSRDQCVTVAEDKDGYRDLDGCPDLDNDGDGIRDVIDRCPNRAEDKDGFEDDDGCPDYDNDGDGTVDIADRCPNKASRKPDGCPDSAIDTLAGKRLGGVRFQTGQAVLTDNAPVGLKRIAATLRALPYLRVQVAGHTDNIGGPALNKQLSQRRANTVKAWLISQGIEASRITTAGFGSSRPVATNATAEGRAKNRRIEIRAR